MIYDLLVNQEDSSGEGMVEEVYYLCEAISPIGIVKRSPIACFQSPDAECWIHALDRFMRTLSTPQTQVLFIVRCGGTSSVVRSREKAMSIRANPFFNWTFHALQTASVTDYITDKAYNINTI